MCDLTALWFVLIKNKNPFSPSLFSRLLGIITKKDILKHMAQMANRDPDSILFNWSLSRLNGHSGTHTQRAESFCEDDDDDDGGGVLLLYSGLRHLFALPPLDLFRQDLFSLPVYRDIVKNAVLSHLWTSHQAWSESLPSELAVCGPNAFPAYSYTFKYGDQQLLFVLFFSFMVLYSTSKVALTSFIWLLVSQADLGCWFWAFIWMETNWVRRF